MLRWSPAGPQSDRRRPMMFRGCIIISSGAVVIGVVVGSFSQKLGPQIDQSVRPAIVVADRIESGNQQHGEYEKKTKKNKQTDRSSSALVLRSSFFQEFPDVLSLYSGLSLSHYAFDYFSVFLGPKTRSAPLPECRQCSPPNVFSCSLQQTSDEK